MHIVKARFQRQVIRATGWNNAADVHACHSITASGGDIVNVKPGSGVTAGSSAVSRGYRHEYRFSSQVPVNRKSRSVWQDILPSLSDAQSSADPNAGLARLSAAVAEIDDKVPWRICKAATRGQLSVVGRADAGASEGVAL